MYSASSSAASSAKADNTFDSSGWSVNFGTQQTVPTWAIVAALAVAAVYLWKKRA